MSDKRGRFVWYDLLTPDIKAAEAFYTKVAGWGTQPWEGMPLHDVDGERRSRSGAS